MGWMVREMDLYHGRYKTRHLSRVRLYPPGQTNLLPPLRSSDWPPGLEEIWSLVSPLGYNLFFHQV